MVPAAADRIAANRVGALPAVGVQEDGTVKLTGLVTVFELLDARERTLYAERVRERVLRLTDLGPARPQPASGTAALPEGRLKGGDRRPPRPLAG